MATSPPTAIPREAVRNGWRIELPEWCQDQRNQMTGPADDAELVVKMLNSGAPGVMLDLEDSTVNEWEHQRLGVENILVGAARNAHLLRQEARPRGRHSAEQDGDLDSPARPAHAPGRHFRRRADVGVAVRRGPHCLQVDPAELKHPLCVLHSQIRVGRRGLVVARRIPGHGRSAGLAEELHQVHGAGGVPPAGVPDGGVSLQPARPHRGIEPRPLGLHGEPDSLQSCRSGVGAARSQHHSATTCRSFRICANCCRRSATSAECSRLAA